MSGYITDRMEGVKSKLEDQFTNLYCKQDFQHQLNIAKKAPNDAKPQSLKKLADMYNAVGVRCEYARSLSYYEGLLKSLQIPDTPRDINQKVMDTLCSLYTEYPTPKEFMQRIVDRLDPDTQLSASLELRILRRFLTTVNVKGNEIYYSSTLEQQIEAEGIDSIGEDIFDVLHHASSAQGNDLRLLKGCYNLAHGNSVSAVSTKELLFLFAFAYDMRYYLSTEADDYDETRDVEKNLFTDYYCDNIARYLVPSSSAAAGTSDNEPSGMVINPKNFVDVLFVYYLNQNGLSAAEKVTGFYKTAKQIKQLWNKQNTYTPERRAEFENKPTKGYLSKLDHTFFALSQAEVIDFVLTNYYCDVRYSYVSQKTGVEGIGSLGIFQLAFTANTAFAQYNSIIELIKEDLSISENTVFAEIFGRLDHRSSLFNDDDAEKKDDFATNANIKYQLELKQWYEQDSIEAMRVYSLFDHTSMLSEDAFRSLIRIENETDRNNFLSIIENTEKKLDPKNALRIDDALNITRTKLVAAYYHYFCLEVGMDAQQRETWKSFSDVYAEMGGCLSDYLRDAGYQEINPKNLFDMLVIFLAYCKINDLLS